MKVYFLLIFIFILGINGVYAQTESDTDIVIHTEHFSYVKRGGERKSNTIRLVPNEYAFNRNNWSNKSYNGEYFITTEMRGRMLKDHQQMLEKHFSMCLLPMSVEDLKVLRKVFFNYYFDRESKFLGYEIFVPSDLFERFPSMERLCAEFGRSLKDYDLSVYDIRPDYPDKFKYSHCTIHLANYINLLLRQK